MLGSNGQDFNQPLSSRRAPLGGVGFPHTLGEQIREPAPKKSSELLVPTDFSAPANFLRAEEARFESLAAEFQKKSQISVFWKSAKEGVSPFVPERLTGPVKFISRLLQIWDLDTSDAIDFLGFEPEDRAVVEAILAGRGSLRGRDSKDRIAALFRVHSLLAELFQDLATERAWLRTERAEFGGRSPIDLLRQGSMESLLRLRQYVEHISGQ